MTWYRQYYLSYRAIIDSIVTCNMPKYPRDSSYLNSRVRDMKQREEQAKKAREEATKTLRSSAIRVTSITNCYFCRKATTKSEDNTFFNTKADPPKPVPACTACMVSSSRRAFFRKRYGIV